MTLKFNVSFFNLNIKRKMGGIIILCVFRSQNIKKTLSILRFFLFSVQQQEKKIKIIN